MTEDTLAELPRGDIFVLAQVLIGRIVRLAFPHTFMPQESKNFANYEKLLGIQSLLVHLVQHFSFPAVPRISGAIEERMKGA